jgi:hypothetical protein
MKNIAKGFTVLFPLVFVLAICGCSNPAGGTPPPGADTVTIILNGVPVECPVTYTDATKTIIQSVTVEDVGEILIGRNADESIELKTVGNALVLRDPDGGIIPIGSYAEFQLINTSTTTLAGKYEQIADLDLMDREWTAIGASTPSGMTFTGSFDGGSHTIANLHIESSQIYQGLFGQISKSATLKNIGIISGSVTGTTVVGGVCGYSNGSITNCYNKGSVTGITQVGGVCGFSSLSITASYNTGSVRGTTNVGGVCGYSSYDTGSVTACYNTGDVTGVRDVGGVSGHNIGSITACYNTGIVTGTSGNVEGNVGGVCGYTEHNSKGSITACYNTGIVTGTTNVGGVCGYNYLLVGSITDCYWHGHGDILGGIGSGTGTATKFGPTAWPTETGAWSTGPNTYWDNLGSWNSGNPVFPKLN